MYFYCHLCNQVIQVNKVLNMRQLGTVITWVLEIKYSGDPEIGPPMGLTESGPILESVRFVKPVTFE